MITGLPIQPEGIETQRWRNTLHLWGFANSTLPGSSIELGRILNPRNPARPDVSAIQHTAEKLRHTLSRMPAHSERRPQLVANLERLEKATPGPVFPPPPPAARFHRHTPARVPSSGMPERGFLYREKRTARNYRVEVTNHDCSTIILRGGHGDMLATQLGDFLGDQPRYVRMDTNGRRWMANNQLGE